MNTNQRGRKRKLSCEASITGGVHLRFGDDDDDEVDEDDDDVVVYDDDQFNNLQQVDEDDDDVVVYDDDQFNNLQQQPQSHLQQPQPQPQQPSRTPTPELHPTFRDAQIDRFRLKGWYTYFMGTLGGQQSEEKATSCLKAVIQMLWCCWNASLASTNAATAAATASLVNSSPPGVCLFVYFICLVGLDALRSPFIAVFSNYMHKPATQKGHCYQLKKAFRWLTFVPDAMDSERFVANKGTFASILADIMTGVNKTVAKNYREVDRSVRTAIEERQWPIDGLRGLQRAFQEHYLVYKTSYTTAALMSLDSQGYARFMQVLVVSLFITGMQARSQAVERMTMRDLSDLFVDGVALSDRLKTAARWGYQALHLSSESKWLLKVYLEFIRPTVVPPNRVIDKGDLVLLDFYGKPLGSNLGHYFTDFYRKTLAINFPITRLRSLFESITHTMLADGLCTPEQRLGVANHQGHSLAIANDVYVRDKRTNDNVHAQRVFNMMPGNLFPGGEGEEEANAGAAATAPAAVAALPLFPIQQMEFGKLHEDGPEVLRARWSEAERAYLANAVNDLMERDAVFYKSRLASVILKKIKSDPAARDIFHLRHCLSPTRLRNGLRERCVERSDRVDWPACEDESDL